LLSAGQHSRRSLHHLQCTMIHEALRNHCCPRRDGAVARPAENTRLGGTPAGYLVGGLRFELSRPVQVMPKPR
jgi:hypothetical protein